MTHEKLKHLPVRTSPLAEIGAAHEMVERGTDGVRAVATL